MGFNSGFKGLKSWVYLPSHIGLLIRARRLSDFLNHYYANQRKPRVSDQITARSTAQKSTEIAGCLPESNLDASPPHVMPASYFVMLSDLLGLHVTILFVSDRDSSRGTNMYDHRSTGRGD